MNMEEVDNLNNWNKATATYVHGIGLNIERMQNPAKNRNDVRTELNIREGELLITSIGELDDNKNHITVLRALATLNQRNFKYVVCGVGPRRADLLSQAEELGLSEYITLAGFRSDIPDILNASDIFVFPSFHEGMPVSALEAMACGLPIICSKIRGNVDIIKEGDNGYLFDPTDINALANKLSYLLNNADTRMIMGSKNKQNVLPFSQQAVTEELKKIYSHV
jgi:glycosyltransferase involved in cell wall biosynthesis